MLFLGRGCILFLGRGEDEAFAMGLFVRVQLSRRRYIHVGCSFSFFLRRYGTLGGGTVLESFAGGYTNGGGVI